MGEDKIIMDNVNVTQVHDKVFKVILRHMAVAKDILRFNLSENVFQEFSLDNLTLYNNDLVDEKLKPLFADLIYVSKSARGPEDDRYLIVEHQSYQDKLLMIRINNYQAALIQQHLKQYPNVTRLPLVFSKVFYQGQENYTPYPTEDLSLLNLFNYEIFGDHFRTTKLDFTDLNLVSDQVLQEHRFGSLAEFVFKHNKTPELLEIFPLLEKIIIKTHELMLKEHEDLLDSYISLALQYLFSRGRTQYPEKVIARVKNLPRVGEQIMGTVAEKIQADFREQALAEVRTVAEKLQADFREQALAEARSLAYKFQEEGRQEGREEGREEERQKALAEAKRIIDNLLERKFSLADISQIMGRPVADIERFITSYK